MSAAAAGAPAPNPDQDLINDRASLLFQDDDVRREIEDRETTRRVIRGRLDEIAAQLKGRAFARRQAAEAAQAEASSKED